MILQLRHHQYSMIQQGMEFLSSVLQMDSMFPGSMTNNSFFLVRFDISQEDILYNLNFLKKCWIYQPDKMYNYLP